MRDVFEDFFRFIFVALVGYLQSAYLQRGERVIQMLMKVYWQGNWSLGKTQRSPVGCHMNLKTVEMVASYLHIAREAH